VEVIRIEGVAFKVEDAEEFAERARAYDTAHPPPPEGEYREGPAWWFAFSIEKCIEDEGDFEVPVTREKIAPVFAVLEEWVQSREAPDAARTLHRALASNTETR
jgi:hypothetical protein